MTDALTLGHVALLGRVEILSELDRFTLAHLAAHLDAIPIPDGTSVVEQGDTGGDLFIVSRGTFVVLAATDEQSIWTQLASLSAGDSFGEMALITGERRSATVRAEGDGEVLRLERDSFLELLHKDPSVGLAVAASLAHRIRARDQIVVEEDQLVAGQIQEALARLEPLRRRQVLEAGLMPEATPIALQALFGEDGEAVALELGALGAGSLPLPRMVQHGLRQLCEREYGHEQVMQLVESAARRLADGGCQKDALALAAQLPQRDLFLSLLVEAVHQAAGVGTYELTQPVEQVTDEEATRDAELAIARAEWYEQQGEVAAAERLLRRVLEHSVEMADGEAGGRLTEALARLTARNGTPETNEATPGRWSAFRSWRSTLGIRVPLALSVAVALGGLAVAAHGSGAPGSRLWTFLLLFTASVALSQSNLFADYVVALALVASWMVFDLAQPAEALAGFASLDWLFVLAVLAMAGAVAQSGLLFRVGLLFIQRMSPRLLWQSATLLLTGILLTPLLPESRGRVALTAPLALSVAQAQRLRDRDPAGALLGLAVWIGSEPLMFLFLNGSPLCLLAWGLLPPDSRERFDWIQWLVAALPLGALVSIGSLGMLYLVFRPHAPLMAARERVQVQLAVLGRPSLREWSMIVVLIATVTAWSFAPALRLDVSTIAVLGLLAAIVTGNFDQRSLRELDWNFLIFYGIALSTAALRASLAGDPGASATLGGSDPSGVVAELLQDIQGERFILIVAALHVLARLVIHQIQAVLLLGIALIPLAPSAGVDPWLVVITLLATSSLWLLRSQTPSFLVAYSATEGRLFSYAQARTAGIGYILVVLLGLGISISYWRWLGLLS